MRPSFEMREPEDCPWRGRQPRYEKLVRLAPKQFALTTKFPSGDPVTVRLGDRLPADGGWGYIERVDCDDAP